MNISPEKNCTAMILIYSIEKWFSDEENGYSELIDKNNYTYLYHELDNYHAYNHIKAKTDNVLGIGSAFGHEFYPIIEKIQNITIIEPSGTFVQESIQGKPCRYVKPNTDGTLPFIDCSFDLITCLSVLHHVPNVGHVVSEIFRCLNKGGYALFREPIVSMGDWREQRAGLTKHERGIPPKLFDNMITEAGFEVVRKKYCCFTPIHKFWLKLFNTSGYNSKIAIRVDSYLSSALSWNDKYHRTTIFRKFAPSGIYYLVTKP
jgi:SAM-dependent methyltransferase